MHNVTKNNYYEKPKENCIMTPPGLAEYIHERVRMSGIPIKTVLDPSVGTGNLLKPFLGCDLVGIDVIDYGWRDGRFILGDFLNQEKVPGVDIIVCNPPWNRSSISEIPGRPLIPELFARRVFDLYGNDMPLVLFAPVGFLFNQKIILKKQRGSDRRRAFLCQYKDAKITLIMTPPLDTFPDVLMQFMVLVYNIPQPEAHSWVPDEYLRS